MTSSGDVGLLAELCLFTDAQGNHVTLTNSGAAPEYVLLNKTEESIFQNIAPRSISLQSLPTNVTRLRKRVHERLNLRELNNEDIITFAQSATESNQELAWYSSFWQWLRSTGPLQQAFVRSLLTSSLRIVPCTDSHLHSFTESIFTCQDQEETTALEDLGLRVVQGDEVKLALQAHSCLHYLHDSKKIVNVLRHIPEEQAMDWDSHARERVTRFLISHLGGSRLESKERRILRALPIYSIVRLHDASTYVTEISSLPINDVLLSIEENVSILPILANHTFVHGPYDVLRYLNEPPTTWKGVQSEDSILQIAAQHIASQPKPLQAALLERISLRVNFLPPTTLQTIKHTPFVANCQEGRLHRPEALLDPNVPSVKALINSGSIHFPRTDDPYEESLVKSLSSLHSFNRHLSDDTVREVATDIATGSTAQAAERFQRSCTLLQHASQGLIKETALPSDVRDMPWLPSEDSLLCTAEQIFYDDIGDTTGGRNFRPPEGRYRAHSSITEDLARHLGLEFASILRRALFDVDPTPMGEDFVTRIRNLLKDYPPDSVFLEFLANAADAGATQFSIILDEYPGTSKDLYNDLETMQSWQNSPSLLFYNDAVFTDQDFKGIRDAGVGGKANTPDKIGRFGMGAISMFNYTEVWNLLMLLRTKAEDFYTHYLLDGDDGLRQSCHVYGSYKGSSEHSTE
jgi:hypothetical protein